LFQYDFNLGDRNHLETHSREEIRVGIYSFLSKPFTRFTFGAR